MIVDRGFRDSAGVLSKLGIPSVLPAKRPKAAYY